MAENQKFTETMNKKMGIPDYDKKVPEDIRKQNTEKFEDLRNEKEKLDKSLALMKSFLN